jgi:hypothetical protein
VSLKKASESARVAVLDLCEAVKTIDDGVAYPRSAPPDAAWKYFMRESGWVRVAQLGGVRAERILGSVTSAKTRG